MYTYILNKKISTFYKDICNSIGGMSNDFIGACFNCFAIYEIDPLIFLKLKSIISCKTMQHVLMLA